MLTPGQERLITLMKVPGRYSMVTKPMVFMTALSENEVR